MADGTFPVSVGFSSHFHLGERIKTGSFRIMKKHIQLTGSSEKGKRFKAVFCFSIIVKLSPSESEKSNTDPMAFFFSFLGL